MGIVIAGLEVAGRDGIGFAFSKDA